MAYIYKIENQINHKVYIGKTEKLNPYERWQEHIKESYKTRNRTRALYAAIKKYGKENFDFSILEETDDPCQREQEYIALYNSYHNGYNETLGGDGGSYLELPEEEICKYYLRTKSIRNTAAYFGHDKDTIRQVLYRKNIQVFPKGTNLKKPVVQIDKNTGEILQIFESAAAAEKIVPTGKHINEVCKGKRQTAGGFKWEYAEIIDDE